MPYKSRSKYYHQSYFDTQISIPEWERHQGRGASGRWNGNRFESVSEFGDGDDLGEDGEGSSVREDSGVWASKLTLGLDLERWEDDEEWWTQRAEMREVGNGAGREAWWADGGR
jgi:hypothetical protein